MRPISYHTKVGCVKWIIPDIAPMFASYKARATSVRTGQYGAYSPLE